MEAYSLAERVMSLRAYWLEIVPRKNQHTAGETISVGVTKEANYPGELIEIPQVRHRQIHHYELQ